MEVANKIRQQDIELLANNPILEELNGKTIMVTGATGLIGSEIVLSFLSANRLKNLKIKVVALVRNKDKAKKIFEKVLNSDYLEIVVQDINDPIQYNGVVDFIIHTASLTSSKDFINKPVETIFTIINGTKNVYDYARKVNPQAIVMTSSLEVYGVMNSENLVSEKEQGEIDFTSVRSSYSEAKRMGENISVAYAKEYSLNIKIARLSQIIGAGFDKNDERVVAQFVKLVANKQNIILHTKGCTVRNYCYLTDAITGLLTILLYGNNFESYNISNKSASISIKDMAEMLAKNNNQEVEYEIDDIDRGYAPDIKLALDTSKLENLGWNAKYGLEYMFKQSVSYYKEELGM